MLELYFIYAGVVCGWCLRSFADEPSVKWSMLSVAAGLIWPISCTYAVWRAYLESKEPHQP